MYPNNFLRTNTIFGVASAAGLLAALLYALGVLINPFIPNDSVFKEGTLLRAATYVVMGAIVGWFASRHRRLVEELQVTGHDAGAPIDLKRNGTRFESNRSWPRADLPAWIRRVGMFLVSS